MRVFQRISISFLALAALCCGACATAKNAAAPHTTTVAAPAWEQTSVRVQTLAEKVGCDLSEDLEQEFLQAVDAASASAESFDEALSGYYRLLVHPKFSKSLLADTLIYDVIVQCAYRAPARVSEWTRRLESDYPRSPHLLAGLLIRLDQKQQSAGTSIPAGVAPTRPVRMPDEARTYAIGIALALRRDVPERPDAVTHGPYLQDVSAPGSATANVRPSADYRRFDLVALKEYRAALEPAEGFRADHAYYQLVQATSAFDPPVPSALDSAEARRGWIREAIALIEHSGDLEQLSRYYQLLGDLGREQHELPLALKDYETAVSLDPKNSEASRLAQKMKLELALEAPGPEAPAAPQPVWRTTAARIRTLAARLKPGAGGQADRRFVAMVETSIASASTFDDFLSQAERLVANRQFRQSRLADSLLYDVIVQLANTDSDAVSDWVAKLERTFPDSPHLLAAMLIALARDEREAGAVARWAKDHGDDLLIHGPYLDVQGGRVVAGSDYASFAAHPLRDFRSSLTSLDGFRAEHAYYKLVEFYVAEGREPWIWEAIRLLEPDGRYGKTVSSYYQKLGDIRLQDHSLTQAADLYLKATAADPKNEEAARLLKRVKFDLSLAAGAAARPEASDEAVVRGYENRNVSTANDSAKAHNLEGMRLYRQGRYDEAVAEFRAAVTKDPKYGKAMFNLACTYALAGDLHQTLKALKNALNLNPGYYLPKARSDPDFAAVRNSSEFQELLQLFQEAR